MGRVMAVTGIPVMLGPMLGPVLGGVLIDYAGWRWIFFINVPIGVFTLLLALRQLPRVRSEPAGPIDVVGFGLLTIGVPALTYGLAEMGQRGVGSPHALVPVAAGLLLLVAFVLHALRATRPLLEIRLYLNRAFAAASLTMFALTGALMGGIILMPLYYQTVRGETAVHTGVLLIPQALGMLVTTPIGGRLSDRIGGGILSMIGVTLAALATVPLVLIGASTSYWTISAILFARGLGIGMTFMPAMAAAFRCLRPDQLADATPQMNMIQRIGGSIGTAIVAVVLGRQIAHASGPSGLAHAFGHTWVWVVAATAVSLVPAGILARVEHRERHAAAGTRVHVPEPEPVG
jgi:EmrB/QacA subfamily drug resistance transporter